MAPLLGWLLVYAAPFTVVVPPLTGPSGLVPVTEPAAPPLSPSTGPPVLGLTRKVKLPATTRRRSTAGLKSMSQTTVAGSGKATATVPLVVKAIELAVPTTAAKPVSGARWYSVAVLFVEFT